MGWELAVDRGVCVLDLARISHRCRGSYAVCPLVGGQCDPELLYLRFCQHGHGQWHVARGGRALAVHQLRGHGHGDAGTRPRDIDVGGQGQTVGAVIIRP